MWSPGAFSVWLARITVLSTKWLSALTQRLDSGRSTSQNRMIRVTSLWFSAVWMNVSSNITASPSRQ